MMISFLKFDINNTQKISTAAKNVKTILKNTVVEGFLRPIGVLSKTLKEIMYGKDFMIDRSLMP